MRKKLLLALLTLVMILGSSLWVYAVDTYGGYAVPVDIAVNGSFIKCAQKPIMINNSTYIPLRAFADAIGGGISWDAGQKAATFTKGSNTFVFYSGRNYCTVNGAQKSYAAVNYKDLLFIPVRFVSESLGYGVEWDSLYLTVKIAAPGVSVADKHKDYSYSFDDMLYLGRITQLESGSQTFKTKIAVCNTILNRVKSSEFPNNVKDVIFDTRYGVQFPPAHTDRMNNTPSKECMIAAKCALNGVNLVGGSLYFVDVEYATSDSWVHTNRTLYTTIGVTNFYK